MSSQQESLFVGIVFGDDRNQSEVDQFRFRSSGLSHLLAVSGQNVAFLLLVVSPVLMRLSLRGRWVLGLAVLGWFLLVTRVEPSVVRACAMATVVATSTWMGRYVSGVRVLSVAVIACMLVDPLLVWSMGFRLSVGASAGLIALARPLARRIGGPRPVAFLIAASFAAQAGTAPILLTFTDSVPLLGPLFNLVAVPVAGWLMMWGVATGPLAGMVGDPLASVVGSISAVMVDWLSFVARIGGSPRWPRMGGLGVAAMTAATIGLAAWDSLCDRWGERRVRKVSRWIVVAVALVASIDVSGVLHGEVEVEAKGFVLWSNSATTVVVIDGPPNDRSLLDAILVARATRVDAVFVLGGGKLSSTSVLILRQVLGVGEVLTSDPALIRDANALTPGRYSIGTLVLDVTHVGDDWTITRSS